MARSHSVPTPDDEVARITLIKPQVDSAEAALQDRVLVGKIFAPKALNKVGVKNNFWKMWDDMQGLHVMDLASNTFAITFPSKNQAGLVLAKAPWYVMGHLLSLQPWGEDQASMEISFNKVPFWVQVHGLPLSYLTVESIHAIVSRMGSVLEIESPVVNGCLLRPFVRARVCIDVSRPLWAGSWVTLGEESSIWVVFKYERLQDFCYNCGIIGHDQKLCRNPKVMASFDKAKPKYGNFLCAHTPKTLAVLANEKELYQFTKPASNTPPEQGQNNVAGTYRNEGQVEGNLEGQDSYSPPQKRTEASMDIPKSNPMTGVAYNKPVQYNNSARLEDYVTRVEVWKNGSRQGLGFVDWTDAHQLVLSTPTASGSRMESRDMIQIPTGGWRETVQRFLPTELWHEVEGPKYDKYELFEVGESSRGGKGKELLQPEAHYYIEMPSDSDNSSQHEAQPRLDQATETELIQTWNARCTLKRDREVAGTLTEVEEELLRRKKQKREAWFDDAGNVVCVAITTPAGIQTYVPDEGGNLVPPSP